MTEKPSGLLALSAAAFLAACTGTPPAGAPAPQPAVAVPANAVLSDERAMELARGYVELLHARDYDGLWQHMAPEEKELFSADQFRSESERTVGVLGAEVAVVSEEVQPARAGMTADKLYVRVSRYAGAETPVRLRIALKNDGSIAGLQVRPAD
jgi:predicted metal-dependent phosphoesterase TrpH